MSSSKFNRAGHGTSAETLGQIEAVIHHLPYIFLQKILAPARWCWWEGRNLVDICWTTMIAVAVGVGANMLIWPPVPMILTSFWRISMIGFFTTLLVPPLIAYVWHLIASKFWRDRPEFYEGLKSIRLIKRTCRRDTTVEAFDNLKAIIVYWVTSFALSFLFGATAFVPLLSFLTLTSILMALGATIWTLVVWIVWRTGGHEGEFGEVFILLEGVLVVLASCEKGWFREK